MNPRRSLITPYSLSRRALSASQSSLRVAGRVRRRNRSRTAPSAGPGGYLRAHGSGRGAGAHRHAARAGARRSLQGRGVPQGRRRRPRPLRSTSCATSPPPATSPTCPGIGSSTARVIAQALDGEVPEYLARLEAEAAPDAGPGAPIRAALQGDLHLHSDWSDGGATIEQMARKAAELGHEYLALTDHSPSLSIAHGLDAERLETQLELVADAQRGARALPHPHRGRGRHPRRRPPRPGRRPARRARRRGRERALEAAHERAADDRPHGRGDGQPEHRHPRPLHRPHGARQGPARVDVRRRPRVRGVPHFDKAVEINCRPERLDPPMRLLEQVVATGCKVSIDSDAHAVGQLEWQPYGCARAAEAGVPDRPTSSTRGRSTGSWRGRPRTRSERGDRAPEPESAPRPAPVSLSGMTSTLVDDPRWLAVLARDDARRLRLRGAHDPRVLPAVVPEPPAAARTRVVLRRRRRRRATTATARVAGAVPTRPRPTSACARVEAACRLLDDGDAPRVGRRRRRASAPTPDALRRDFRRVLGVSPKQYADGQRVERLRAELRDGRDVTGALYTAGYGSSSRLYEQSDARLGHDAGVVRRGRRRRVDHVHDRRRARSGGSSWRRPRAASAGSRSAPRRSRSRPGCGASSPPPTIARDDATLAPVVDEVLRRIDGDAPARRAPARRARHRVPAARVAGAAAHPAGRDPQLRRDRRRGRRARRRAGRRRGVRQQPGVDRRALSPGGHRDRWARRVRVGRRREGAPARRGKGRAPLSRPRGPARSRPRRRSPRIRSRCSSSDDARRRATDACTLVSRSVNAPKRTFALGGVPAAASMRSASAFSSSPCMPHLVCCTTITSRVPSACCEIASERTTSSVTSPPALRSTCASPGTSPSARAGSMRASMHVTSTTGRTGWASSSPWSNDGGEAVVVLEQLVGCTHAGPVSHPRRSAPTPAPAGSANAA